MFTLTAINQKGGVGKTTTIINVAAAFATADDLKLLKTGLRTLVVDLDPQANATLGLGIPNTDRSPGTADLLKNKRYDDITNAIRPTALDRLHIIPASPALQDSLDHLAIANPGNEQRLHDQIELLADDYDVVLIDSPPNLGITFQLAMRAARWFVIPTQLSAFAMHGMTNLLAAIAAQRKTIPNPANPLGVVLTNLDYRSARIRENEHNVRNSYRTEHPNLFFNTAIKVNRALDDAQAAGQPIFLADPRAASAADYADLTREIITRARQRQAFPFR